MTHLFISHSGEDRVLAFALKERLEAKGYEVFLDFSRKHGIAGGTAWEKAILDAMRKSAAVLLCYTPSVADSRWVFAEVMIARYEGKRVFPLLFRGTGENIWEFLKEIQYINFKDDPEQGYERLFEALERAGYDTLPSLGSTNIVRQLNRPPYMGLQPLQAEDHPIFFARRQDVDRLVELLQPRFGGSRCRFITVVGPSGSGKSSMVRAGLLPRIVSGAIPGSQDWVTVTFTPGSNPFRRLAEALLRAVPALQNVRTIEKELRTDEKGLDYVISDVLAMRPSNSNVLLIIDQSEELITRVNDPNEAKRFLDALLIAIGDDDEQNGRLIAIATLRADFYAAFLEISSNAAALLQNTYPLGSLTLDRLREVIEDPARIAQITLEDGLVQRILDDAGTSDVLPLLSFVLRSMYDNMNLNERTFTHTLYEKVGSLQGALGLHAERIFKELPDPVGIALINTTLQHLITITTDGIAARRKMRKRMLPIEARTGADKFIEARLFVASEEEGEATVEVAHEAIFRNWNRLRDAIEKESATSKYLRQALHQSVADWERLGVFLGMEQRRLLNANKQSINLDGLELELALRSAIRANEEIEYWFNRLSQESTKVLSIARGIFEKGDPTSKHHLLDFLEYLIQEGRKDLIELITVVANSQYPALRRQANRILLMYSVTKHTDKKEELVLPTDFLPIVADECLIGPTDNQIKLFVGSFDMSKYLVTNFEYLQFVKATGHNKPAHWTSDLGFFGKCEHPVVYVSFYDAVAYCRWLSSVTGQTYRLPTELEWEKVASWNALMQIKSKYAWSDTFDSQLCNTREAGIADTTPIGQYMPHGGDSPYGASDMAGNVWEWTCTLGRDATGKIIEYPYLEQRPCDSVDIWGLRVQRGGTFLAGEEFATTTYRLLNPPELALQDFGFRIVHEQEKQGH